MSELAVASLPLDQAETVRLADLEDTIERGLVHVGQALAQIRDEQLWRGTYESFRDYCLDRWSMSHRHANRKIQAAKVIEELGHMCPEPNQRQANELAPLLDNPEQLREAWAKANERGSASALKVREAVARVLPPVSEEAREKQRRWAATMNVLDGLAHFDREPVSEQAEIEAGLIDKTAAASRGQDVTAERLRNASAWTALLADALDRRQT